jgi:hypothetical protein
MAQQRPCAAEFDIIWMGGDGEDVEFQRVKVRRLRRRLRTKRVSHNVHKVHGGKKSQVGSSKFHAQATMAIAVKNA